MQTAFKIRHAGILLVAFTTLAAWGSRHDKVEGPAPAVRISTATLGYYPLSSFYLMGRTSSVSLDFIDDDHLLFTFRVPGLLKRMPECKSDDEDQVIRAMVLHLPDGAIERSADWRMHDRGRYLWALRNGQFLVRQRDTLLLTDLKLQLKPFLQSPTPIRLVKLSPGGQLLLVESDLEKHSEEEHRKLTEEAELEGLSTPRGRRANVDYACRGRKPWLAAPGRSTRPIFRLLRMASSRRSPARATTGCCATGPFTGEPSNVADVASSCHPNQNPVSDKTVFVSLCPQRQRRSYFCGDLAHRQGLYGAPSGTATSSGQRWRRRRTGSGLPSAPLESRGR